MVLGARGALRVVGCVHGVRWCLARGWICGGSVYESLRCISNESRINEFQ